MPASLSLLGADIRGTKEHALNTDKSFEDYEAYLKKSNIILYYWKYAIESVLAMVRTNRAYRGVGGKWGKLLNLIKEQRLMKKFANASEDNQGLMFRERALQILKQKTASERSPEDLELLLSVFPNLNRHCHDKEMALLIAGEMKCKRVELGEIVYHQGEVGKEFFGVLRGQLHMWVNGKSQLVHEIKKKERSKSSSDRVAVETAHDVIAKHGYDALSVAILRPGDIFTRQGRSIHYYEVCAYVVADEESEVAYIDAKKYDDIIMQSRVKMNETLQREVMSRRRQSLLMANPKDAAGKAAKRGAVKSLFKHAASRAKIKKEKIMGNMSALSLAKTIIDEKDKIRVTMGKLPSSRHVDELERTVKYLDGLGFWEKFDNLKDGILMTSQAKRDCVKNMSMTTFWKKEILFEEGDVGNYFFFILSGSVVIRKRHGSTSTSLCILGPGDSFGELALSRQSTDGTRTATVVSREVSEFLVLHKVHYLENLSKYQESHLKERVALIQSSSIYRHMPWSTKVLQTVCYPMEKQLHELDKVICKQGGKAASCYMIERGEVNVFKNIQVNNGNEFVNMPLGRLGPGDFFGMKAAGGDTYGMTVRHNITVVCTSPVIVHALTRYDIFNRLETAARIELKKYSNTYDDDILLSRQVQNFDAVLNLRSQNMKELFPVKYLERINHVTLDVVERAREQVLKKRNNRTLPRDVPGMVSSDRRYSLKAQQISLAAISLEDTQASFKRQLTAMQAVKLRSHSKSMVGSRSLPTLPMAGKSRRKVRRGSTPPLAEPSDPYDMWTINLNSKSLTSSSDRTKKIALPSSRNKRKLDPLD